MPQPIIVLLTDFGVSSTYAAAMKGVIAGIAPQAKVIDLSHAIPRGDLRRGAFALWQSSPFFPEGTIFLCVVDPGVGTERAALALSWSGHKYVGPDNGLVSYLIVRDGQPESYQLMEPAFRLDQVSSTFHGRDIFAPAAAHLASGVAIAEMGPPIKNLVRFPPPRLEVRGEGEIVAEVMHPDSFGNLITSLGTLHRSNAAESPGGSSLLTLDPWLDQCPAMELTAAGLRLQLPDDRELPLVETFADVPAGDPLAYIGSSSLLEIGVNQGDAAKALSLSTGEEVVLYAQG